MAEQVSVESFREYLDRKFDTLERLILLATQADIDALTNALAQLQAELTADDGAIQAELAKLSQANPSVDLTGLQSAVSNLSTQVQNTTALVPPATGTGTGSGTTPTS